MGKLAGKSWGSCEVTLPGDFHLWVNSLFANLSNQLTREHPHVLSFWVTCLSAVLALKMMSGINFDVY